MSVKLLTEHHLEFLSSKGGFTGSSESTLVKMPHYWKSRVAAQTQNGNFDVWPLSISVFPCAYTEETYANETALRTLLESGYSTAVRPRTPTTINIFFALRVLDSLVGQSRVTSDIWLIRTVALFVSYFNYGLKIYIKAAYSVTMNIFRKNLLSF